MLCGSRRCGCAFESSSTITVTGTGEPSDPWQLAGSATPNPVVRTYTASDTWSKPAGLKYVIVEVQGGGGGSGGVATTAAGQASASNGAGGGGYARKLILAAALAASETVTVGAGGAAGTSAPGAGGNGGASSFGAHCTGNGGNGSAAGAAFTAPHLDATDPGDGGTATGGDINVRGGRGYGVFNSTAARGRRAGGGHSFLAFGGVQDDFRTTTTGAIGGPGTLYGGGAGGALNCQSQASTRAGAAGAAGIVIVTEYYE